MAGIFLSYRRDDSGGHAGRLADDFRQAFASDVWRDIEAIEAGADFVAAIGDAVDACTVLLTLIGPRWLDAKDAAGKRRLDDERDFVRIEIAMALDRGVRVIPILVGGAAMPAESDLPATLRPLARRQAHELSDKRWEYDVNRLFESLEKLPGLARRKAGPRGDPVAAPPARGPGIPGWAKGVIGVCGALGGLAILVNMMESSSNPPGVEEYAARAVEQLNQSRPVSAPTIAPPPARAAASVPEPAAPVVRTVPKSALAGVGGIWVSPEGDGLYIEQQGGQLSIVAADAAQQHGFLGQGAVQGRNVRMMLMHLQSGLNMEIRAMLSEDGRRMQGTAHMPATGATENFTLTRR